jgi:hypothetical protein
VVPSFAWGGWRHKKEIIFDLIEGKSVGDALVIFVEDGFKCEAKSCHWANARYAHENPTVGLSVDILIVKLEGDGRVSKDNVQIIANTVVMGQRDPWLK